MATRTTTGPVGSPIQQERGFDFRSDSSESGDSDGGGEVNRSTRTSSTVVYDDRNSVSREGAPPVVGFGARLSHVHVEPPPTLNPRNTLASTLHSMESRSNLGIKGSIWALHADEMVALAQRNRPSLDRSDPYYVLVRKIIGHYLHFLRATWTRCAWSLLVLPGNSIDRLSMVAFALVSSWVLFGLMIWCLFINLPYLVKNFNQWSSKNAGGLSMANAAYPAISQKTASADPGVRAAREALARPMPSRLEVHDQESVRIFNLDIAKLLFQCAALMYERTSSPLLDVLGMTRKHFDAGGLSTAPETAEPGQALKDVVGSVAAKLVSECLHPQNDEENEMTRFAAKLGMKYATVSELNSQCSACAGMFWDPTSTFIILAFKGTAPDEFVEWAGDFSYEPRDAGDWIRGFGKVHGGFMERVFPRRVAPGARVPYYTIRDAVRHTASHLSERHPPGTKINIWFTGHSLGTAIASLVYARAINEPRDFGPNVTIRDAFMYAAPILCDVQSAHSFHNRMYHDERRTIWRITNSFDCVATALPDWGNDLRMHLSPYNLFSFSHLGIELTMHPAPKNKVVLSGNAMPHGSPVFIEGTKTVEEGSVEDEEIQKAAREKIARLMAYPLLGRIVSHGIAPYWDQLQRVQTGRCEWEEI